MKRIMQTDTSKETGNCLQACIASLLGLTLDDVPHFFALYKKNCVVQMQQWVKTEHNFGTIVIVPDSDWHGVTGSIGLGVIQSELYPEQSHCVIVRVGEYCQFQIIHDPNPLRVNKTLNRAVPLRRVMFFVHYPTGDFKSWQ